MENSAKYFGQLMIYGLFLDPRAWAIDYLPSKSWKPEKYGIKIDMHPNADHIPKTGIDKKYKFVIASEVWEIPMRKTLEYLRKNGLKIFLIPREPFKTHILKDVMFRYPKFLYNGEYYLTPDALLAPNKVYAGFWKDKTKTIVTGYPRFDYLFTEQNRPNVSDKKTIFFPSYPPYYHRVDGMTDINSGREETLLALEEFAKSSDEYRVVVKIHPMSFKCYRKGTGSGTEVSGTLLKYYKAPTDYMKVVGDVRMSGDIAKDTLLSADIVVGFTSTMLLEALTLNKPVMHLLFGNTTGVNFSAYKSHLPTAYNKDELFEFLKNPYKTDAKQLIEDYLFKVDGKSCDRICNAINKLT